MSTTTLTRVINEQLNNLLPAFQRYYERSINKDLSSHQWQGLFSRNLLNTLDKLFDDALTLVEQQRIAMGELNPLESNELLAEIDQLVNHGKDQLMNHALNYNRSSCALSNFPDEHAPSPTYFAEVLMQIEQRHADWQQALSMRVMAA